MLYTVHYATFRQVRGTLMTSTLFALIDHMPKAELHMHIEGSLEPELLFTLAQRNAIQLPYESVEALRQAYHFRNLQEFLDLYYQGMSVLITEADFYDLTMAYLQRAHRDKVVHVEIFFDPQGHLERGVSFDTQFQGIYTALQDAQKNLGISFVLIMCFLRHLSAESALETLALAEPYLDRIHGVGLDSSELGHPPEKFTQVFAQCRELGLKLTMHAGEEGPPDYVWQAVNDIQVDRIDHGNRCLEDEALVSHIVAKNLTLTVCPLSNLKLCVVKNMTQHPILRMLDKGLRVTVNSDDPAYFGGYIGDNYRALVEHLPITSSHLYQLGCNAIEGSWMDETEKRKHLATLRQVFA